MDGSTPWMCPRSHGALKFHSGWELLGEAEAGGSCCTSKKWGGNWDAERPSGRLVVCHKIQGNQRYALVGINPDASGEKLQQWEFTLHRSLLYSQVTSSVSMGFSISRASGCGSSQPQCPFLVASSCRTIPGFPELLESQSPPGAVTPEPPWQPLSLSLTGQLGLPSGVPTGFCEGSQCPLLLGGDIPGHRALVSVLVWGGEGLVHQLPQMQVKRGRRSP